MTHADQQTRDEAGITAVQGWVPEDAIPTVEAYVDKNGLACLAEAPGPDEHPPTLIEEKPEMEAGGAGGHRRGIRGLRLRVRPGRERGDPGGRGLLMANAATETPVPSSGVDALIAKLREQGVAAGRGEGDKIVAEARAKGKQIVDKAQEEAKSHLEASRKEAAALQAAGEEAIRTAMRDTIPDIVSPAQAGKSTPL